MINWLLYFPIELLLSKYTDVLVTINQEDYQLAVKYNMARFNIYKINGVGVDLERFVPFSIKERVEKRLSIGFNPDDFIILYTAQFIARKNHKMIIESLPNLIKIIQNLIVVFAGNGETFESSKLLAKKLGVDSKIKFLGGRRDINVLCAISDIHLSTSIQEGLAISNIEAMACGCPIVISKIRGHIDVCVDNENGFLFDLNNSNEMEAAIIKLYKDKDLYNKISEFNKIDVLKYSVTKEVECMGEIYDATLQNN